MKRAAVATPSNIAEGQGGQHAEEFRHPLSVGNGSPAELDTQRIIAGSLQFFNPGQGARLEESITEVRKMLYPLAARLKTEN